MPASLATIHSYIPLKSMLAAEMLRREEFLFRKGIILNLELQSYSAFVWFSRVPSILQKIFAIGIPLTVHSMKNGFPMRGLFGVSLRLVILGTAVQNVLLRFSSTIIINNSLQNSNSVVNCLCGGESVSELNVFVAMRQL